MAFFSSRRQTDADATERDEHSQLPRPTLPQQPIGFETVLGANGTMEGTLVSSGNVRLDGTFTGTLDITGNVLVGETAKITADIDARNISIAGAVRGNVTGNKVQLLRTGRIWGDINANALTTEEGAFIDGKITMKGHEANNPRAHDAFITDEAVDDEAIIEAPAPVETVEEAEVVAVPALDSDGGDDAVPEDDAGHIDAVDEINDPEDDTQRS